MGDPCAFHCIPVDGDHGLVMPHLQDSLVCIDGMVRHSLLPQPQHLEAPKVGSIIPLSLGRSIIVLEDFCSNAECLSVVEHANKLGFQSLRGQYPQELRKGERLLVSDVDFAHVLWSRLQAAMAESSDLQEVLLAGLPFGFGLEPHLSWRPIGVNAGIRICRYSAAAVDGFAQHFDSQYCPSQLRRSIFSILMYLTDETVGGDTVFYHHSKECFGDPEPSSLEGYAREQVGPKIGRVVLFPHDTLHAGLQPSGGVKMLIRSDLVYLCDSDIPYPMNEWPDHEQEAFLKALSDFREAQNLEIATKDSGSLEKASALYSESLRLRRAFGPVTRRERALVLATLQKRADDATCFASAVTAVELATYDKVQFGVQPFSLLPSVGTWISGIRWQVGIAPQGSRPRKWGNEVTTMEIMRKLSPVDQDAVAETCRVNRDYISKVHPHLHAPWLPQLHHRSGLECIMTFDKGAFVAAKEACLRVAAMEAIAQFGHRCGSPWFISEWDPTLQHVLAVPKSALLGAVYHELPCKGVYMHLECEARVDELINRPESDDEEVRSDNEADCSADECDWHYHGMPRTSERTCCQELPMNRMLAQMDVQLVKALFSREGGMNIAEKCFVSHDEELFGTVAEDREGDWDDDTAKGLPVLKDWLSNAWFGDHLSAYLEEGLQQLKDGQPSYTVLQGLKASVNFGAECQHHGWVDLHRYGPRILSGPVVKSLLMNNLIFDFRSSRLKVRQLGDVEDALSDLEKELIAEQAPYEAAYVAEIERKTFNHAACQCGDDGENELLSRLQMGPSFLLHHVVLLMNCERELWRCKDADSNSVCIKTIYGGVVAL